MSTNVDGTFLTRPRVCFLESFEGKRPICFQVGRFCGFSCFYEGRLCYNGIGRKRTFGVNHTNGI
jgi:hypothetical protein